jgi:hypothetical protein
MTVSWATPIASGSSLASGARTPPASVSVIRFLLPVGPPHGPPGTFSARYACIIQQATFDGNGSRNLLPPLSQNQVLCGY